MNYQDKPAFFIVALNQATNGAEAVTLNKFGFKEYKEVVGCYKGETERSYLILADSPKTTQAVYNMACQFDQETILYVNTNREASLLPTNPDGPQVFIGDFTEVPEYEAKRQDSWTYDPMFNRYYIARKE